MKFKRIVLYVREDLYNRFRGLLLMQGDTASGWLRKQIEKYLKTHE